MTAAQTTRPVKQTAANNPVLAREKAIQDVTRLPIGNATKIAGQEVWRISPIWFMINGVEIGGADRSIATALAIEAVLSAADTTAAWGIAE